MFTRKQRAARAARLGHYPVYARPSYAPVRQGRDQFFNALAEGIAEKLLIDIGSKYPNGLPLVAERGLGPLHGTGRSAQELLRAVEAGIKVRISNDAVLRSIELSQASDGKRSIHVVLEPI
jgi:hypothetical protein